jgi:hypothetical protein
LSQEDGRKSEKYKDRERLKDKDSPRRESYFGDCLRKSGTNGDLIVTRRYD